MNNPIPVYEHFQTNSVANLKKNFFFKEISTSLPHRRFGGFTLLFIFLITSLKQSQPLTTLNLKEGKYAVENRGKRTEKKKSLLTGKAPHVVSSHSVECFTQRCLQTSKPRFILKAITYHAVYHGGII